MKPLTARELIEERLRELQLDPNHLASFVNNPCFDKFMDFLNKEIEYVSHQILELEPHNGEDFTRLHNEIYLRTYYKTLVFVRSWFDRLRMKARRHNGR